MDSTGVLAGKAFKLFRGSIDLLPGGSGAKGQEQENVLLLGDGVVNQTIPLILCGEEDVEGNHGRNHRPPGRKDAVLPRQPWHS